MFPSPFPRAFSLSARVDAAVVADLSLPPQAALCMSDFCVVPGGCAPRFVPSVSIGAYRCFNPRVTHLRQCGWVTWERTSEFFGKRNELCR